MSSKAATILVIALAIVIAVLAWFLWTTPASAPTTNAPAATSSAATSTPAAAASSTSQVTVTTPISDQTVGHSFELAGTAPGPWFFEAQFPAQVQDKNGSTVGSSTVRAQGNWQTAGLVTFTATVTVNASFKGPATLILSKDNPSGLPQNASQVTIPIVIQ